MNNSFKKSSEIFDYAKTLFPGGTQFLSKQPHRSGCDDWPTYYTYAEGIKIIDYFGNEFFRRKVSPYQNRQITRKVFPVNQKLNKGVKKLKRYFLLNFPQKEGFKIRKVTRS